MGIVLLAGLIVYGNSFSGVFVFDGRPTIRDNLQIRSLTPFWALIASPLAGSTAEGRPVANLLSAVNWVMADGSTWPFHAANLVIHLITALLIFGLVRRTVPLAGNDPDIKNAAPMLAGATAILWVVHPLNTGAVTYINQRVESLMAMFVLATLYLALRSDRSTRPRWYWAGAFMTCLLAVGSKEVAVITPLLVLVFDRTFLAGSFKKAWTARWPLYTLLLCSWILLAVLVFSTEGRGGTAGYGSGIGVWQYFRSQPAMITRYLKLVIWPDPLVFYHGARPLTHLGELVSGFVIIGGIGLASIWALLRRSWLGFAGLLFFASLAPSSSVIPIATEIGAEHRMYLALSAVLVVLVVACFQLSTRINRRNALPLFAVVVSTIVVVLGCTTWSRNKVFHSETTLWQSTTQADPSNVAAWDNLGCALRDERHDIDAALVAFDQALSIDPDYVESLQERGYTLTLKKKHRQGLADLDRALVLAPEHTTARFRRAVTRGSSGDLQGALDDLSMLIQALPENPTLYLQRGIAHLNLGSNDLALSDLDKAVLLDPKLTSAYQARAAARMRIGDEQGARRDVATLKMLGGTVPGPLQHLDQ